MKRLISTIIFVLMLNTLCLAQQMQNKRLKIYSITEYIDGYVIKGIDTSNSDTLNIISLKGVVKSKNKYKRLLVGETYNFEYEDYISSIAAMPIDNFKIRIKTTILWSDGDNIKERPVFSKNTRNLLIKRE